MNIFAIAAGMMAVIHLVAGWQRPRLAVIVSGMHPQPRRPPERYNQRDRSLLEALARGV